jgi:hypothetical protein
MLLLCHACRLDFDGCYFALYAESNWAYYGPIDNPAFSTDSDTSTFTK